jgi:hypothetical protein
MNGTISLKVGPQMLSVKCTVSDQYAKAVREKMHGDRRPRVPEDYALCSFSSENKPQILEDTKPEFIDISTPLKAGDAVILTGYGCTTISITSDLEISKGKSDNKLRVGDALVTTQAASSSFFDDSFVSVLDSNGKTPTLCPGDSGGPLLSNAGAGANSGKPRAVRGVNSYITIKNDKRGVPRLVSAMAPLSSEHFRSFVAAWRSGRPERRICGLDIERGDERCKE